MLKRELRLTLIQSLLEQDFFVRTTLFVSIYSLDR